MKSFQNYVEEQLDEVAHISDFADIYLLELLPDSDDPRADYVRESVFKKAKKKIQEEIEFMLITEFAGVALSTDHELLQIIGNASIEMFYEMPDHMRSLKEGTYDITFDKLNIKLQRENPDKNIPHVDYDFVKRGFYANEKESGEDLKWSVVAEVAEKMNEAESFNNYVYLFDRFVDLVHHSGTMLGHFYAQKNPKGALKSFLDFKQNTQRIDKLLKYVSPALKRSIKSIQDWYNVFSISKHPELNEKVLLQNFLNKLEQSKNVMDLVYALKYAEYRLNSEQTDEVIDKYLTKYPNMEDKFAQAIQIFIDSKDENN